MASGGVTWHPSQAAALRIGFADSQPDEDAMSKDDKRDEDRSKKLKQAGVAVGIGSAAIVAALLYASKVKKPKRGGAPPESSD